MSWTLLASAGGAPLALDPWLGLTLGLFLVLLNGFFVAAEFALVKLRPTQLAPFVARGDRRGLMARQMVRHLDAYLSACQLGITLASLALGWVGEPAFAWVVAPVVMKLPGASPALLHSISLTLAFLTITVLHIVIGELAPKSLAIRKPLGTGLWVAAPLFVFYKLTYPGIWVLNHAANRFLLLFGIEPAGEAEIGHDEEELRLLLGSSQASRLSAQKRQLLDNVFELSHRRARQIMVPRRDVVYLTTTRSREENLALARRSGHTRFPLCEGDLDEIVGLVHIKDIFRTDELPPTLRPLARPILFVPEALGLDLLLRRLRQERAHMAAVLDEYGGVSGLVTLEDVVEEIVGEIQDEFDGESPLLAQQRKGVWEVSAAMLVVDFEEAVAYDLSDRDEDTLAGVVLSELGRRAAPGDRVVLRGLELEVLTVDGNRIRTLRATLPEARQDPVTGPRPS